MYANLCQDFLKRLPLLSELQTTDDQEKARLLDAYEKCIEEKLVFKTSYLKRRKGYLEDLIKCSSIVSQYPSLSVTDHPFRDRITSSIDGIIQSLTKLVEQSFLEEPLIQDKLDQNDQERYQNLLKKYQNLMGDKAFDYDVIFETISKVEKISRYLSPEDCIDKPPTSEDTGEVQVNLVRVSESEKLYKILYEYIRGSGDQEAFLNFVICGPPGVGKSSLANSFRDLIGMLFLFESPGSKSNTVWTEKQIEMIGMENMFLLSLGRCSVFDEAYELLESNNAEREMATLVRLQEDFKRCSSLILVMYTRDQFGRFSSLNRGFGRRIMTVFDMENLSVNSISAFVIKKLKAAGIVLDEWSTAQIYNSVGFLKSSGMIENQNFSFVNGFSSALVPLLTNPGKIPPAEMIHNAAMFYLSHNTTA